MNCEIGFSKTGKLFLFLRPWIEVERKPQPRALWKLRNLIVPGLVAEGLRIDYHPLGRSLATGNVFLLFLGHFFHAFFPPFFNYFVTLSTWYKYTINRGGNQVWATI
jgi:hypothetical protein